MSCGNCPYEIEQREDEGISDCTSALAYDALALLKEQETVIRCKDCKYGEPWGVLIGCGTAKGFGITHKPDWFCADGERKEDK
jgi:hypothetical protein